MLELEKALMRAEERCQSKGLKLTMKRKLILAGLIQSNKALSVYELIEVCKQNGDYVVPAMSAYRILKLLSQENLVHKLKLANKYVACSHIACSHSHGIPQFLICIECDKVEEVQAKNATMDELSHNAESVGFSIIQPQLEIECVCKVCMQ